MLTEVTSFAKEVAVEFSDDDCLSMAAAIAYYTVFSLAPLLVIVIVIAGLFVSPDQASEAVHGQFAGLLGASGAEQIRTMVEQVQANPGGTLAARILGVVAVLFGGAGVMLQLQKALNRAWNVKPDPKHGGVQHFLMKRVLSLAMILAVAFLLLVSLVVTALLSAVAARAESLLPAGLSWASAELVNFGVSLLVVTGLFTAIFKFMPEARIRWRDVAVGGLVTGLLFSLGKAGIGIYLGNSHVGTAYGTASSLAIVLVWVYYSAVILLFGAEFTQVWTRRYGTGSHPVAGAVVADLPTRTAQEPAMGKHNRDKFITRDALMDTLSDEEISSVSGAEAHPNLVPGEEYLDLAHLGLGVRLAAEGDSTLRNVVPRRAVPDGTWHKLVKQLKKAPHPKA